MSRERAEAAIAAATTPEGVVAGTIGALIGTVGDRQAHLVPGALGPGQHQFFVGGAFLATPDRTALMLVGNHGFPPEQRRLMIPIDGGHPGRVMASAAPLLLEDTRQHQVFRQYLNTARMGSAIYAPLIWNGAAQGLLILAAQAANTMRASDLALLIGLAPLVAARWQALGGPNWLVAEVAAVRAGGGVLDHGR